MRNSRFSPHLLATGLLWVSAIFAIPSVAFATDLKVLEFSSASTVRVMNGQKAVQLNTGEHSGDWTLVEVIQGATGKTPSYAVFEDFAHRDGHVLFVDQRGVQIDLPKSSEPTSADPSTLYRGHTLGQIMDSPSDLLGGEILAKPGDPDYEEVAAVFPPIRKIKTYSFVGTQETPDKVGFVYGGRTPNFDPGPLLRSD